MMRWRDGRMHNCTNCHSSGCTLRFKARDVAPDGIPGMRISSPRQSQRRGVYAIRRSARWLRNADVHSTVDAHLGCEVELEKLTHHVVFARRKGLVRKSEWQWVVVLMLRRLLQA